MFLDYYDLTDQPFGVTPDPRFIYLNRTYREALASLWYGIKEGRGFLALVAQPGMGKTTLLVQLMQRLRAHSTRIVFLFHTCCNSLDLIRYLLQDLNINPATDLPSMHQQLNDALVREAEAGNQVVFVIDEAQNLSDGVLETIRLLSDFETPQGKLVQIVLAGQPQLLTTLKKPGMRQLRQRISVIAAIDPLRAEEVANYVDHRLAVAGYRGDSLFTQGAVELIACQSGGIPRNINNLCFGALSNGFALRCRKIGRRLVEEVVADQNLTAIEMKVTATSVKRYSPKCETALFPPSSVVRESPRLSSLLSWFGPKVRRAAYIAIVPAIFLIAMASPSLRLQAQICAHRLYADGPIALMRALTRGMSAESQPLSVGTTAVVQAAAPTKISATDDAVIVEPGDTLRQISLRNLGRYSTRIVHEIQAVNPQLVDPNRIEPGQRLRMPFQQEVPDSNRPGHLLRSGGATAGSK